MSFILAIFNWILFSSLLACLLIPVIIFVKTTIKDKLSPAWHYFIWFILVIRLILPFTPASSYSILNIIPKFNNIIVPKTYQFQEPTKKNNSNEMKITAGLVKIPLTNTQSGTSQDIHNYPAQIITKLDNKMPRKININIIVLLVWLIGIIIFGGKVVFKNWCLHKKIRNNSQEAHELEKTILEDCKKSLKIRANIPLILTTVVRSPGLYGVVRPVLLLPLYLSDQISSDELRHIFLHELTHYQRRDSIVNALTMIIKVIHWFNPMVWYGFRLMHEDCEMACDAMVLSQMEAKERLEYGHTIIHLLRITKPKCIPGVVGIIANQSKMKKRIIMISSFEKSSISSKVLGTTLLILLGTVLLTGAKNSYAAQSIKSNSLTASQMSSDNYPGQHLGNPEKKSTIISLLDVKGQNFAGKFTGKMMIVPDPSKVEIGFSLKNSKPDKTTSDLAKVNKAVGAINGGASNTDSVFGPAVSAQGIVFNKGNLIFDDLKDDNSAQNVVALTDKGKLIVGSRTIEELKKSSVKEAVSSGLPLIINGAAQNLTNYYGLYSMTAIGQKADGTILLLVINGRSTESLGATLQDIQTILLEHGASNAALLDGGSLSTMVFQGKIMNKPPEGEQIVTTAILVMP